MGLHLQEGLDLADCEIFPVTQSDELVKSAEQFVGILEDLPLFQALASTCDNLGEQVERIDILEDVGLAVRNEDHVEFVEGLIHETDVVLLNGSMLCACVGQLGERC